MCECFVLSAEYKRKFEGVLFSELSVIRSRFLIFSSVAVFHKLSSTRPTSYRFTSFGLGLVFEILPSEDFFVWKAMRFQSGNVKVSKVIGDANTVI